MRTLTFVILLTIRMIDRIALVLAGAMLVSTLLLGGIHLVQSSSVGRYAFVGAGPKDVVTFDTATGRVLVGRPVNLEPQEQS